MSTDKEQEQNENMSNVEDAQEELSLGRLSQAYAKVLKVRQREEGALASESKELSAEAETNIGESTKAKSMLDFAVEKKARKRKRKSPDEIDSADNAACPISPESILEAILFVGVPKGVKLTGRNIAAVMRDVSPKEVRKMAGDLNKKYEQENAAYRVVVDGGHYSLQLCQDLLPVQNHFFGRDRPARLSQGAIDVLAVVAYNQPVPRDRVEKIRAKPSGAILSQLVRRELLDIEQTATKPIKKLYRTTDRFLSLFGLESIEDLPQTSIVSDLEELVD